MNLRIVRPLTLSAALLLPCPALADPMDPAGARELLKQGYALKQEGKYDEALARLVESLRMDSQIKTLVNIADCEENLHQLTQAQKHWILARDQASMQGDSTLTAETEKRLAALEARMPRLTINRVGAKIDGMEVRRNGVLLGEVAIGVAMPVDPTPQTVVVTAPGHQEKRFTVEVAENETKVLEVTAGDALGSAAPASAAAAGPVSGSPSSGTPPADASTNSTIDSGVDDPGGTQRTLGWVAGGAGVVGLGLGIAFTLQKSSKLDERDAVCPSHTNCATGDNDRIDALTEEARNANTLAMVSFIGGGVALAAGAVLILTAPKAHASQAARNTWVLPVAGRDGFGVFAGQRF